MRSHHLVAVPLAAAVAALLVVDTVVVASTGERTVVTDDALGTPVTRALVGVLLAATVLACLAVVLRERALFEGAPRAARLARRPLLVGLAMLAVGGTLLRLLRQALGLADDGPLTAVSDALAGLALLLVFVPLLVVGLTTLRRNVFGLGGQVLAAIGPVVVLTVALAALAPDVASPVIVTGVALVGTSLLGVRAVRPAVRAATPV